MFVEIFSQQRLDRVDLSRNREFQMEEAIILAVVMTCEESVTRPANSSLS